MHGRIERGGGRSAVRRRRAATAAAKLRVLRAFADAVARGGARRIHRACMVAAARALGAQAASVSVPRALGELEVACAAGYAPQVIEAWRRYPLHAPGPAADAFHRRTAVWIASPDALAAAYPELARIPGALGSGAWGAIPLVARGSVYGVLALAFPPGRVPDAGDRALARTLATFTAQALAAEALAVAAPAGSPAPALPAKEPAPSLDRSFETAIQVAPAGIAIYDGRDLRLRWANALYREFVWESRQPRPLEGSRVEEIIPRAAERGVAAIFRRAADTGEPHVEPEFEHPDAYRGATWWRWSVVPIRGEGPPFDLVVTIADLTDQVRSRRRAEESAAALLVALNDRKRLLAEVEARNAELEAILASIVDGLVIYDAGGAILRMNEEARKLLDFGPDERRLPLAERVRGSGMRTAGGAPLDPEDTATARALRGEVVRGMVMAISRGGATRWISASGAPIRDAEGRLAGAVATFFDMTELHELQDAREDLLRALSHDVRTPLMVILHQAESLRRTAAAAEDVRRLGIVTTSAQRIASMIDEIVDVVRLESGRAPPRLGPVAPVALAADVLERLRGTLPVERVTLEATDEARRVIADAARLERVLVNLLSNAFKYAPAGSPVVLRISASRDGVAFEVMDRGPGIAPEDLPHVFDRFYRARAAATAEGLGLGLYIARRLVESQGGTIAAASREGGGAVLRFTLPPAP